MRTSDQFKDVSYGAVAPPSPRDAEAGKALRDVRKERLVGKRVINDPDGEPRMSLLHHSKQDDQRAGWWETCWFKTKAFLKERIVAIVLWAVALTFVALVIARIVHVQQNKHK